MKRLLPAFFALLLLFATASSALASTRRGAFQKTSSDPLVRKNFFEYSSSSVAWKKHAFADLSFLYPGDWKQVNVSGGRQVAVVHSTDLQPNVTVIYASYDLSAKELDAAGLDTLFYVESTISSDSTTIDYDRYLPSYHPLGSSDATLLGHAARMYDYTAERGSKPVRGRTLLTSIGKKTYRVSIQSTAEQFEKDLPVFNSFVSSLQLGIFQASSRPPRIRGKQMSSAASVSRARPTQKTLREGRLKKGGSVSSK